MQCDGWCQSDVGLGSPILQGLRTQCSPPAQKPSPPTYTTMDSADGCHARVQDCLLELRFNGSWYVSMFANSVGVVKMSVKVDVKSS